ncbi:hypothetical protein Dimus_018022 [Dionaea muscipula]
MRPPSSTQFLDVWPALQFIMYGDNPMWMWTAQEHAVGSLIAKIFPTPCMHDSPHILESSPIYVNLHMDLMAVKGLILVQATQGIHRMRPMRPAELPTQQHFMQRTATLHAVSRVFAWAVKKKHGRAMSPFGEEPITSRAAASWRGASTDEQQPPQRPVSPSTSDGAMEQLHVASSGIPGSRRLRAAARNPFTSRAASLGEQRHPAGRAATPPPRGHHHRSRPAGSAASGHKPMLRPAGVSPCCG